MKILLDQMFGVDIRQFLQTAGFDVLSVSQLGMARADDAEILQTAIKEKRILITLDEHFGDWGVLPLKQHYGVIRIKVKPAISSNIVRVLGGFLNKFKDRNYDNLLVIASERGVRWISTCE